MKRSVYFIVSPLLVLLLGIALMITPAPADAQTLNFALVLWWVYYVY